MSAVVDRLSHPHGRDFGRGRLAVARFRGGGFAGCPGTWYNGLVTGGARTVDEAIRTRTRTVRVIPLCPYDTYFGPLKLERELERAS